MIPGKEKGFKLESRTGETCAARIFDSQWRGLPERKGSELYQYEVE